MTGRRDDNKNDKTGNRRKTMKKLLMTAAAVLAIAFSGIAGASAQTVKVGFSPEA